MRQSRSSARGVQIELWYPSRTTSGTRTTGWEPLLYMLNKFWLNFWGLSLG